MNNPYEMSRSPRKDKFKKLLKNFNPKSFDPSTHKRTIKSYSEFNENYDYKNTRGTKHKITKKEFEFFNKKLKQLNFKTHEYERDYLNYTVSYKSEYIDLELNIQYRSSGDWDKYFYIVSIDYISDEKDDEPEGVNDYFRNHRLPEIEFYTFDELEDFDEIIPDIKECIKTLKEIENHINDEIDLKQIGLI